MLVYGGGLKYRVYVNYLYCTQRCDIQEEIIGILDDDIKLHGLRLYGFKVLGRAADVEKIYMDHPFDKIVITTSLHQSENEELLRDFCKSKNISLTRLIIREEASPTELIPEIPELTESFKTQFEDKIS